MDGPNLAGFTSFLRNVAGIDTTVLPDGSVYIVYAFNIAMQIANPEIGLGIGPPPPDDTWSIYELAVYNLGTDRLINFCPDQSGQTFFQTLRGPVASGGYGMNAFSAGVVETAFDQGTGNSLAVPDSLKNLTLMDLQMLKTPYGQQYLAFAQMTGSSWGIS